MDASPPPSLPLRWGATVEEWGRTYHCDELAPPSSDRAIRAVSVAASCESTFAWLGNLRLAPYSYDLVDNFGRRSPRHLDSSLPPLAPGQRVMTIFEAVRVRPSEELTVRVLGAGSRLFGDVIVTYAVRPAPTGSRLVAVLRFGQPSGPVPGLRRALLGWGDLVMMRKQLLTLAERAVETGRSTGG